jgi:hypothetical protein
MYTELSSMAKIKPEPAPSAARVPPNQLDTMATTFMLTTESFAELTISEKVPDCT